MPAVTLKPHSVGEDAQGKMSFAVKNTFIEVDNDFEDDGFESALEGMLAKRQVSEPVMKFGRQLSSRPTLGAVREDSGSGEEPETEIEPQSTAFARFATAEVDPVKDLGLNINAFPWSQSAPFSQPAMYSDLMMDYMMQAPESQLDMSSGLGMPLPGLGQEMMDYPMSQGHDVSQGVHAGPAALSLAASVGPETLGPATGAAATAPPPEWGETVTVMMRNLPNRYTQHMLLEEIANAGFAGQFDFFYLPIDPDTVANKGYAFINFVDSECSWRFKVVFEGKQMARFNSSKFVSVSPAALQGLEANHAHYSTARCSRGDPAARPLFLREPTQGGRASGGGGATRRGGQRRRNNGKSLVDVAIQKQQQRQVPPAEPAAYAPEATDASLVPKFCPYCGGATQPNFRFCQFCGAAQAARHAGAQP